MSTWARSAARIGWVCADWWVTRALVGWAVVPGPQPIHGPRRPPRPVPVLHPRPRHQAHHRRRRRLRRRRHPDHPHPSPGTPHERGRGTLHRHPAPGMPRPPPDHQTTPPRRGAARIRSARQHPPPPPLAALLAAIEDDDDDAIRGDDKDRAFRAVFVGVVARSSSRCRALVVAVAGFVVMVAPDRGRALAPAGGVLSCRAPGGAANG